MKRSVVVIILLLSVFVSAVAQTKDGRNEKKTAKEIRKERAENKKKERKENEAKVDKDTSEFIFVIERMMPSYDKLTLACDIRVEKGEVRCALPVDTDNSPFMRFFSTNFDYEKRTTSNGVNISLRLKKTSPDNTPCLIDIEIPKRGEASAYVRMLTLNGGSYTFLGIVKPLPDREGNFVGSGGYSISF